MLRDQPRSRGDKKRVLVTGFTSSCIKENGLLQLVSSYPASKALTLLNSVNKYLGQTKGLACLPAH